MQCKMIGQLADGVCARMAELGFSEGSIKNYARIYTRYASYAEASGRRRHDAETAERFVEEMYGGSKSEQMARRACMVLEYFGATGIVADLFGQLKQGSKRDLLASEVGLQPLLSK